MKRVTWILLGLAALYSLNVSAEEWRKTYTVSGKPDIQVNANDADLRVYTSDRKDVEVIVIADGYKIGDNDVRVTDRQSGDRLVFEVSRPHHNVLFNFHSKGIRVELNIPRTADLNLHTGDGDIRVQPVTGNLQLDSGDGNIEAMGVAGPLKADTKDGNIRAQGVFTALDLHTGDGNVDAEVDSGSKMNSAWALRTGDGNISLQVPADFGAELDAHTGDGRVNVDVPVTVNGGLRETSIRGKINSGGQYLELRTGDGDISVRRG